jgi:hypothetical protein
MIKKREKKKNRETKRNIEKTKGKRKEVPRKE